MEFLHHLRSVNLYIKTSNFSCLPVAFVVEEFRATKARAGITFQIYQDGKVSHASKSITCGRGKEIPASS